MRRYWILLLLIQPSCTAFYGLPIIPKHKHAYQSASTQQLTQLIIHSNEIDYSTNDKPAFRLCSSNQDQDGEKEDNLDLPLPSTGSPSSSTPVPVPSRQQSQLDPLFVAVTKMDPQTQRASTIPIPVWGELILDRSLFALLPIALFAVGGILLSIYILINSSDTFVDAIAETSMKQSIPTSTFDSNDCRGLCSSQSQDLEGLRMFMNRIGGK
jgi:hypothetical protein